MYNVISNDCTSGWFYKNNNLMNSTIFPWCRIPDEEYIRMIKNYNNIDFSQTKVKYYWEIPYKDILEKFWKYNYGNGLDIHNQMMFGLVDSYIVIFTHYFFDPTYFDEIRKDGVDIRSAKIREYIENGLNRRYKRMKIANKKAYIFSLRTDHNINLSTIEEFLNIQENVPKIILDEHNCKTFKNMVESYNNVLYIPNNFLNKEVSEEIKNYIDYFYSYKKILRKYKFK